MRNVCDTREARRWPPKQLERVLGERWKARGRAGQRARDDVGVAFQFR